MKRPQNAPTLFEPYRLGPLELPHRMVMAPLTRSRSLQPGNVPWELNALYYAQRACAAFMVSEATQVSQQGQGYAWTPGIHTEEQVRGWRKVTDAVHSAGGRIFLQLWHVGRISHPSHQPDGMLPVAPSALRPEGEAFVELEDGRGGFAPFVTPRALTLEEIPYVIQQFMRGAQNAKKAGFDGVEIHSANGYLLDQFINSVSNHREDAYGGPVENRCRLTLEITRAVTEVWGSQRVGVRLSPLGTFNGMEDATPVETFGTLARELSRMDLAYLHVIRPVVRGNEDLETVDERAREVLDTMRREYPGTLILCGGFGRDAAEEALQAGEADLIAFGRSFLANPDLPERFRRGAPLNEADRGTFYGGGAEGYLDYPALDRTGRAAWGS